MRVSSNGYQAFGLHLLTDLPLPGAWSPSREAAAEPLEITLDRSVPTELQVAVLEWTAPIDGSPLVLTLGADGRRLFTHSTGRYLLSSDARRLRCAPADATDPAWFRVLLDSVLLCTALVRGKEGLHAASIILDGEVCAIAARSGGGKTTLVAELMKQGHELVADDISFLATAADSRFTVLPGPPVMTLPAPLASGPEPLLNIGNESWVSVNVSERRAPLRAIVYLNRHPNAATEIRAVDNVAQRLLGSLLALPRTPERAISRLDVAARLASSCAVVELSADTSTSATKLAELVLHEFART